MKIFCGPMTCTANCYITKPVGFKQFFQMVHKIEDFWLTVVRLPNSTQ